MSVKSVRERRRAETVAEIKAAALDQLAETGAGSLSLRGVGRAVGMTVQSLYHYFPSRDALLGALVADAFNDLADAVQKAVDESRGRPPCTRRMAACAAYRDWAQAHAARFLLIYGTPVPGFVPLPEQRTGDAARRLAAPFVEAVFDGWTPEQVAAVPLPPEIGPADAVQVPGLPLPPGALALLTELRARMHGLVILELLGHLEPLQEYAPGLFRSSMARISDEVDALHASLEAR